MCRLSHCLLLSQGSLFQAGSESEPQTEPLS